MGCTQSKQNSSSKKSSSVRPGKTTATRDATTSSLWAFTHSANGHDGSNAHHHSGHSGGHSHGGDHGCGGGGDGGGGGGD
ncbi:hypothetical protein CC86DRAFT_368138, partial [Ophiobolus disseminans]